MDSIQNKDSLIEVLASPFSINDTTKDFNIKVTAYPFTKLIEYDIEIKPIIVEKTIEMPKEYIEVHNYLYYIISFITGVFTWEIIR